MGKIERESARGKKEIRRDRQIERKIRREKWKERLGNWMRMIG